MVPIFETSQSIRNLEYCYLLMASDISSAFIDNTHYIEEPWVGDEPPRVYEIAENLISLYYNIYKTIHSSRIYLESVS